ncbi:MAG TPA: hypothetical protein VNX65_02270 [Patescibacteria group bacterium]|jgi:hypothetical protein|nr:hypothetical protein [Patescibacteria group bacterium]
MLSAKFVNRIRNEVPLDGEFEKNSTELEFLNAAKYLKGTLKADEDDIIAFLKGLYIAVAEEYGA